jgi:sugar phosphate isomerase/epimerase
MARPITLFTGQWADLPFEDVARLAGEWGYDGLEIACWGDHLDPWRWDDDAYVQEKLDILERQTTSRARPSAMTPLTNGTAASCRTMSGATATLKGCAAAPPRK